MPNIGVLLPLRLGQATQNYGKWT